MIRTKKPKPKIKKLKKPINKQITPKQLKFVGLYLGDNGLFDYQCYMQVFTRTKKKAHARVLACNLLKRPQVKKYIDDIRQKTKDKTQIKQEHAIQGYKRIAMFDHRKLYKDKKILHIADLDDDTAMGLHGIEFGTYQIKKKVNGQTKTKTQVYLKNIKTEGRKGAWDSICELLGFNKAEQGSPEEFVDEVRGFADSLANAIPGGKL